MKIYREPSPELWNKIIQRPLFDVTDLHSSVAELLSEIRKNGEPALREFTLRFDGVEPKEWQITAEELLASENFIDDQLKSAMQVAAKNIEIFHKAQQINPVRTETTPGVWCWQKPVPIEKVGLYIPGGTAPLFSTVLMLAIPARIAGCREIVLCTPPSSNGSVHPAILYAAKLAGVTRIYKLGGVQAIGAMAFGVVTPRVDKIFGPGNQYVTAAKQLVSFSDVAIDMPAGPSEVAIMADETAHPSFIAADLLSQAEHGADSQVLLVLKGDALLSSIERELELQLNQLPRKEMATKALENSSVVIFNHEDEMVRLINLYAPEHLIISTADSHSLCDKIYNAGSVFLGHYTPESAGDYASGTNHTLPTNGWAKSFSGVNLDSFVKKITYQEISVEGLTKLGPHIETLAAAEQLEAHKNAVTLRLNSISNRN